MEIHFFYRTKMCTEKAFEKKRFLEAIQIPTNTQCIIKPSQACHAWTCLCIITCSLCGSPDRQMFVWVPSPQCSVLHTLCWSGLFLSLSPSLSGFFLMTPLVNSPPPSIHLHRKSNTFSGHNHRVWKRRGKGRRFQRLFYHHHLHPKKGLLGGMAFLGFFF